MRLPPAATHGPQGKARLTHPGGSVPPPAAGSQPNSAHAPNPSPQSFPKNPYPPPRSRGRSPSGSLIETRIPQQQLDLRQGKRVRQGGDADSTSLHPRFPGDGFPVRIPLGRVLDRLRQVVREGSVLGENGRQSLHFGNAPGLPNVTDWPDLASLRGEAAVSLWFFLAGRTQRSFGSVDVSRVSCVVTMA